jgi:hypothetical protein
VRSTAIMMNGPVLQRLALAAYFGPGAADGRA